MTREPTNLQKAVERIEFKLDKGIHLYRGDLEELLSAAKKVEALQKENEGLKEQQKANEDFLLNSICINKVKHESSYQGCIYCALAEKVKENEKLREALNKIGFYCAGESMISQVVLEAITNLTLTAQNLDPMPPLPSTSTADNK